MLLHLLDLNTFERAITTDQEVRIPPVAGRLDRTQLVASGHLKQHVTCTCNHHHPLQTLDPHLPNQLIASHVNFDFSTTTSLHLASHSPPSPNTYSAAMSPLSDLEDEKKQYQEQVRHQLSPQI